MVPDLPVDIYGVIAEFLAGAFAFATLANLNVANQEIRDFTTPVLYETLLLDRELDWERYKIGKGTDAGYAALYTDLPSKSSLKYTKYCDRVNEEEGSRPPDIGLELPNLFATLIVNPRITGPRPGRSQLATLVLHKPVTTFSLLGVVCQCPVRDIEFVNDQLQGDWKFVVEPIGAVHDVLLDGDGGLLALKQDWKTHVLVDNAVEMKEILGSPDSLSELLALSGRRIATQGAVTGRILECWLSCDVEQDDCFNTSLPGLSEFEFRMNRDDFVAFRSWFFTVSLADPVILGNHIRVDIGTCSKYRSVTALAASLPDLGFLVSQLNTRLGEADHSGVLEAPNVRDRDRHDTGEPFTWLAIDMRFDYIGGDSLWFHSEVFEASALRCHSWRIVVHDGTTRYSMPRPDFLDTLLADEQDGIPDGVDPSEWRT